MNVNKSGEYFKEWTHRLILENYQKYNKSRETLQDKDVFEKKEQKMIQFIGYNGPAIQVHTTKKLLTPFLIFQSDTFTDFDKISRNEFRQYFFEFTFNEIIKEFPLILENLNHKTISYNLISKLGITYFSGRAVNLKLNYSLKDVSNILNGIKVDNVQKGAKLNTSFNSNKGIIDQIEFENFLRRNKFKFAGKRKFYSLRVYDKIKNLGIDLELDENFRLVKATSEKEKSFNIDYLRDRRKSFDKTSGTFLDIFDLRFQFSCIKNINQDELYDLLSISNTNENNILNDLVKLSENGRDLIINKCIGQKFKYFRESNIRIFSVPSKNESVDKKSNFKEYFNVNIAKVAEYYKKGHDTCQANLEDESNVQDNFEETRERNDTGEIVLEKKLIANSTVYCDFDINKWILLWDKANFAEDSFRETLSNLGLHLFDQIHSFSNEIFRINNLYKSSNLSTKSASGQNPNGWLLDLIETKSNRISPVSTVKIFYQNQLVDQDNFSFLKKIVFSKNYLEIFDLNLKTAAELEDGDLNSFYKSVIAKLNFYTGNGNDSENSDENSVISEKESKGLVRVAINKLNDAFNVLNIKSKRENYLKKLSSQRKYRK